MKKLTALIGSCFFFFIVMTLYLILDQFTATLDKDGFIKQVRGLTPLVAASAFSQCLVLKYVSLKTFKINVIANKLWSICGHFLIKLYLLYTSERWGGY